MGIDATNIANAGMNKAMDYVTGMMPEEAAKVLDNLSGISSKIQVGMDKISGLEDSLPEFKNYKPEDPFKLEDREMGISRNEEGGDEEMMEFENGAEEKSKTRKLKEKFQEGVKNIIPGLDPDTILENLAERCKPLQAAMKPIRDSIYYIQENKRISPEEKKARIAELKEKKKEQIKAWKDSQREYVEHVISDIKADFGEIKFGVENLTTMIPIVISQINLPTFIGTGAPNPARIAADFLSYKHMLQSMAHPLQTAACKMLDNCDRIGFDLPDPILKTVETVAELGKLIDQLPG